MFVLCSGAIHGSHRPHVQVKIISDINRNPSSLNQLAFYWVSMKTTARLVNNYVSDFEVNYLNRAQLLLSLKSSSTQVKNTSSGLISYREPSKLLVPWIVAQQKIALAFEQKQHGLKQYNL